MDKTYELNLSSTQQIIQINETTQPFDATVMVASTTGAPFEMLLVDGEQLNKFGDNNKAVFEKALSGVLSANIKNKDAIWYLLLKSDTENTVRVNLKETYTSPQQDNVKPSKKKINWGLIILITLALLGIGFFLFNKFFKHKENAVIVPQEPSVNVSSTTSPEDDILSQINNLPEI